jgi:hypothetical protein
MSADNLIASIARSWPTNTREGFKEAVVSNPSDFGSHSARSLSNDNPLGIVKFLGDLLATLKPLRSVQGYAPVASALLLLQICDG